MSKRSMNELPELLTVEELAEYFGVSRATAYNWVKSGTIKSLKIANTRRIKKADLIELLDTATSH